MSIFSRHDRLNCGNCEFAQARHGSAEALAAAEAVGHPIPELHCLRYPTPVPKRASDACGEHSELIALRQREAADYAAIALTKQLQEAARVMPVRGPAPVAGDLGRL